MFGIFDILLSFALGFTSALVCLAVYMLNVKAKIEKSEGKESQK